MVDGTGFAELGAWSQSHLLLQLLLFAAAAPMVLGAHAAALFVWGTHVGAVKSLGAAETQMRHIGEFKLETLAAFQACVRGRPCLVSKHHTHAHHKITQLWPQATLPSPLSQTHHFLSGSECPGKDYTIRLHLTFPKCTPTYLHLPIPASFQKLPVRRFPFRSFALQAQRGDRHAIALPAPLPSLRRAHPQVAIQPTIHFVVGSRGAEQE